MSSLVVKIEENIVASDVRVAVKTNDKGWFWVEKTVDDCNESTINETIDEFFEASGTASSGRRGHFLENNKHF